MWSRVSRGILISKRMDGSGGCQTQGLDDVRQKDDQDIDAGDPGITKQDPDPLAKAAQPGADRSGHRPEEEDHLTGIFGKRPGLSGSKMQSFAVDGLEKIRCVRYTRRHQQKQDAPSDTSQCVHQLWSAGERDKTSFPAGARISSRVSGVE